MMDTFCSQDMNNMSVNLFRWKLLLFYLGVASGRPPSTGMVAPVVGV